MLIPFSEQLLSPGTDLQGDEEGVKMALDLRERIQYLHLNKYQIRIHAIPDMMTVINFHTRLVNEYGHGYNSHLFILS